MAKRTKSALGIERPLNFETLESRQLLAVAVLSADADTYVGGGAGAGSAADLDVRGFGGGDRIAYIRFDLSSVSGTISDATLRLRETAGSRNDFITNGRHELYGLTNAAGNTPQNWNEFVDLNPGAEYDNTSGNDIDLAQVFNLDPEKGANVLESIPGTDNVDVTTTGADLVTFLNQRVADNGLTTFIVAIDSDNRGYGFASKENSNAAFHPELTIEVDGEVGGDPYPENPVRFTRQVEDLDRGLVAVKRSSSEVYIGWRMLGTDPTDVSFNLYRKSNGGAPVKLNGSPITNTTDWVDQPSALESHEYFVRAIVNGVEQGPTEPASIPDYATVAAFATPRQFINVPLQIPAGGTTPDSVSYTYSANDVSVGDVDGDGEYEYIVKWSPSNSKDNAQSGYTGNTIIEAYKVDGTRLWSIDLGINIRSGAHYTQFMVYDFDGDGKAEIAMKTAEGSRDALGNYIANDAGKFVGTFPTGVNNAADHRNSGGYILTGYEFLTIFDGQTGVELATTYYNPPRNDDINSSNVSAWGDNYGNRVDRFLAGVAYLDGERPSLIMARGYYTRTVLAAYDWRDGQLTERWVFDSDDPGNGAFAGQGNHQLSVADVDGDGYDEILYGSMTVDHDGSGLYTTGLGHGDAYHVSDMIPSNPGLEVFSIHESAGSNGNVGASIRDAQNGDIIFDIYGSGDIGRGVAADIDPNHEGYEYWATTSDPGESRYIYASDGTQLYTTPSNMFYNFVVWWDGDLSRELLDGTTISEWNNPGRSNFDLDPAVGGTQQYAPNSSSNNGTKSTPALSADIFGDWREEVIWRRSDNTALQIFTTTINASDRLYTLMHDTMYRTSIAWQNVGYNQPPHPSFWLGEGMSAQMQPDVYVAAATSPIPGDFDGDDNVDSNDLVIWEQTYSTSPGGGDFGDADGDGMATGLDLLIWQQNFGQSQPLLAASSASSSALALSTTESSATSHATLFEGVTSVEFPTADLEDETSVPEVDTGFVSSSNDPLEANSSIDSELSLAGTATRAKDPSTSSTTNGYQDDVDGAFESLDSGELDTFYNIY